MYTWEPGRHGRPLYRPSKQGAPPNIGKKKSELPDIYGEFRKIHTSPTSRITTRPLGIPDSCARDRHPARSMYIRLRKLDCSTNYKNISAHSPLINVYVGTGRRTALLGGGGALCKYDKKETLHITFRPIFSHFYTVAALLVISEAAKIGKNAAYSTIFNTIYIDNCLIYTICQFIHWRWSEDSVSNRGRLRKYDKNATLNIAISPISSILHSTALRDISEGAEIE